MLLWVTNDLEVRAARLATCPVDLCFGSPAQSGTTACSNGALTSPHRTGHATIKCAVTLPSSGLTRPRHMCLDHCERN